MDDRHERIRQRAYEIWEREGRPDGREHEHWDRATKEIDAESSEIAQDPDAASAVTGSSPKQVAGAEPAIEEQSKDSTPKRRSAKPKSPID
jgi:hypothetical protein